MASCTSGVQALAEALVPAVRLRMLLNDLLDREAARVVRRLRMISDPEILIASIARRLRHRFQRIRPV
jgi:hypothetical protein